MGETCYDACLIITPEEGSETVSVETLVVPDYFADTFTGGCLLFTQDHEWKAGTGYPDVWPGPRGRGRHHRRRHVRAWAGGEVTRCLCGGVPPGPDI